MAMANHNHHPLMELLTIRLGPQAGKSLVIPALAPNGGGGQGLAARGGL
jgi:hypothetical protein